MNKCTERVYNGLIKENPTFVLMLVCVRHLRLRHLQSMELVWDFQQQLYWSFPIC